LALTQGDAYYQLDTNVYPNGNLRGQLIPILSLTRRAIPVSIETKNGTTSAPNGLATLRHANQQGKETNFGSFVQLHATQINSTGNFTYLALFTFQSATARRNFDLVRGLSLEVNFRTFGSAVWQVSFFDSSTGGYVTGATLSNATLWTAGFIDQYSPFVSSWTNSRRQLIVRITTDSLSSSTLELDLFGLRSYVPSSFANGNFRGAIKETLLFPSKL